MAIEFTDAVNGDGLFDILGKQFHALAVLNTARLTTVPQEVLDAINQYKKKTDATLDMERAVRNAAGAVRTWQNAGNGIANAIRLDAQGLLIEVVAADAPQPNRTLRNALEYLIAAMEAGSYYVDGNSVGASLSAGGSNSTTDLVIAYTVLDGLGRACQNLLAESVLIEVSSVSSPARPTLRTAGEPETDLLSQDWPQGSGTRVQISATDAARSLADNGDFEDESIANVPDEWLIKAGVIGTDVLLSVFEKQEIAITGSPTDGFYLLEYTDANGVTHATRPLEPDDGEAAVQAALRAIPGLERVLVTSTGTSPNFTHLVEFVGVAGEQTLLAAVNHLDTGSINITQSVAGDDHAYKGKALILSSASADPDLYLPLGNLADETVYFVHFRAQLDQSSDPAAGELTVSIVDGIEGTVTQDAAGNNNELVLDLADGDVSASDEGHSSHWFSFRLARGQSLPVYLRIQVTEAISAGTQVYIDELAITAGRELYPGGPTIAAFSGRQPPIVGDRWTLTTTNNRAGLFQEWFNRVFAMAEKGLQLPTSGSNLINDNLIA